MCSERAHTTQQGAASTQRLRLAQQPPPRRHPHQAVHKGVRCAGREGRAVPHSRVRPPPCAALALMLAAQHATSAGRPSRPLQKTLAQQKARRTHPPWRPRSAAVKCVCVCGYKTRAYAPPTTKAGIRTVQPRSAGKRGQGMHPHPIHSMCHPPTHMYTHTGTAFQQWAWWSCQRVQDRATVRGGRHAGTICR
jgi:hypothetical protein